MPQVVTNASGGGSGVAGVAGAKGVRTRSSRKVKLCRDKGVSGFVNARTRILLYSTPFAKLGIVHEVASGVVCLSMHVDGKSLSKYFASTCAWKEGHRNPTIFHQRVPEHCDAAIAKDRAHIGRRRRIARGDRELEGVADIGGGRVAVAGNYGDADRRLRHRSRRRRTTHSAGADRINGQPGGRGDTIRQFIHVDIVEAVGREGVTEFRPRDCAALVRD